LTTVKSRLNAKSRRNFNRLFILYNDRIFFEIGFVRHIFAVFPPRAHPIRATAEDAAEESQLPSTTTPEYP